MMCLAGAWTESRAWAEPGTSNSSALSLIAAKDVAPAGPPPRTSDPFITPKADGSGALARAAIAEPAPAAKEDDEVLAPVVLTLVHEVFTMDQRTLLTVLNAHSDGPQRHSHIIQLLAAKKAVLEHVAAITTRSGVRCKIESVHEFKYPDAFHAPDAASQIGRPTLHETRELGDVVEFEPTLGADGETIDVTLFVEESRFTGWSESGLSQRGAITAHPVIARRQISTSRTLTAGKPSCIGTLSPHPVPASEETPGASESASLAFLTVLIPRPEERSTTHLDRELYDESALNLAYTFYSLDRETARDLLTGQSAFSVHDRISNMVEAGTARFERVLELATRSGQRSKAQELEEVIFPTEIRTLTFAGAVPGAHIGAAFETRFTGCTIEQEPTQSAGALIYDVTVAPEFVRVLTFGTPGVFADLWPKLPVFESRKLSTSLSMVRDRPTFFGTFNFPRETGMAGATDDGRVWLGFVKGSSPPR
jgi:hypothetical protein